MHAAVNVPHVEQKLALHARHSSGSAKWLNLTPSEHELQNQTQTGAQGGVSLYHLVILTDYKINTAMAASPEDGKSLDSLSYPFVGCSPASYPLTPQLTAPLNNGNWAELHLQKMLSITLQL